jgi:uncharacterized membrane protein
MITLVTRLRPTQTVRKTSIMGKKKGPKAKKKNYDSDEEGEENVTTEEIVTEEAKIEEVQEEKKSEEPQPSAAPQETETQENAYPVKVEYCPGIV